MLIRGDIGDAALIEKTMQSGLAKQIVVNNATQARLAKPIYIRYIYREIESAAKVADYCQGVARVANLPASMQVQIRLLTVNLVQLRAAWKARDVAEGTKQITAPADVRNAVASLGKWLAAAAQVGYTESSPIADAPGNALSYMAKQLKKGADELGLPKLPKIPDWLLPVGLGLAGLAVVAYAAATARSYLPKGGTS